jgi:quercetin dioxygenase-like cupin family protein
VTAWTARAAGDLVINEHDEDDSTADQELFIVLSGHAMFELDGDRVDAPTGTLVFAPPRTKRMATAKADGTTIIALEGTPARRTRPAAGNSGLRLPPSTRRASTPRSPTD